MMWFILIVSMAVAIGRFLVPGHALSWAGTYEALAHIWVGALLVWGLSGPDSPPGRRQRPTASWITALICLVVLTLVEVVKFLSR